MANRFGEQQDREEQLDRDHEREGGYGSYLPGRGRSSVTLIPKPSAAGVLQPLIPIKPPTKKTIALAPDATQMWMSCNAIGGEQ